MITFSPVACWADIKIGLLTDLSAFGSDVTGKGSLAAVRMAVEDFGGRIGNDGIEVVSADTQNKPDIAANLARRFFDSEHVDVIVDLPQSAVALTVQEIARERGKVLLITSAVTSDLTGRACSPLTIHWAENTNALAFGTAGALTKAGFKRWFFVTADFAFGHAMEKAATAVIDQAGGQVVGSVKPPVDTSDFSSFLLSASGSDAQVIALANVGNDFVTAVKQAHEFGVAQSGKRLTGLLTYLSDIHSIGLDYAQGILVTTSYYWNDTDAARSFAERFEKSEGRKPNKSHASLYAAVKHYLSAVQKVGKDAASVVQEMKRTPADYVGKPAHIRQNGRVVFDLGLYRVKSPSESKQPWDLYEKTDTISGEQAFATSGDTPCARPVGVP